ncbi:AraC family transcriptional regulator [Paenibacillus spongiae]|uniref:AraC family transcriptional regulator n=1 Tax=Paenibacillus spongiae TaxID=2909671 RepID=A0ABY5S9K0_9BACL|nr:AraC family transcriptional regulator [Paenibacillus spongiae]UVI30606.1 AraC family transcriptional regulator [Paenibacillus spongiae]
MKGATALKKETVSLPDLRSRILSANFYSFSPRQLVKTRFPYVHVFVYITAGKGIVTIGDQTWKAETGDLFYLAPGVPHSYTADPVDPMVHASVYVDLLSPSTPKWKGDQQLNTFTPSAFDESICASLVTFSEGLSIPARISAPRNTPWMKPFFAVIEAFPEQAVGNDLLLRAYFESFFVRYLQYSQKESSTFSDPRIGKLTNWLGKAETSQVDCSEWAERLGMSVSYLYELFHKQTGTSPQQYLIKCKLDKAKAYLRETNLPVTEIAEKLGFSSLHYFARQFSRVVQEPATQYRQRFRGKL